MTESRQKILGKIRQSLGRGKLTEEQCARLDQRVSDRGGQIRPAFADDLVTHFSTRLLAVAGSFEQVKSQQGIYPAIMRHLSDHGLTHQLLAAPGLKHLSWPSQLDVRHGNTEGDDLVSVTGCFAAVAETGTVVMLSGEDSPTSLNFLPDYHIVLLNKSQLLKHIEDVWALMREQRINMPRTVNLISGPSKTADVEQTLQIGAHGPRSFHVILIEDQ